MNRLASFPISPSPATPGANSQVVLSSSGLCCNAGTDQSPPRMRRELDGFVLDAVLAAAPDGVLVPQIRISGADGAVLSRHAFDGVYFGDVRAGEHFVAERLAAIRSAQYGKLVFG
ncbi:hypothetical protein [Xanthomonas graminis]|uniref:hypothetical protein n=1 Tax=Xanthomonas graminis TaxID=3390026 RepID=UPI001E3575FD|nr:hypothetical protein [Xanthomonas translucens]